MFKKITTPLLVILVVYVFVYFVLSSREKVIIDGKPTGDYVILVGMTTINFIFSPIGNAEVNLRGFYGERWSYRQYMPNNAFE